MKKTLVTVLAAGTLIIGASLAIAQQGEKPKLQPATPVKTDGKVTDIKKPEIKTPDVKMPFTPEEMAKFQENATPGTEHAQLAQLIGTWKTDVTMWMNGVESKSTGTATYTKVLNGLFVHGTCTGEMPGMPFAFEGSEIVGYNKTTKKFECLWADNMGSGMMMSTGTADSQGKNFTFTGAFECPVQGHIACKTTWTFNSKDQFTVEMFNDTNGKNEKMMKAVYTRTAEAPKPAAGGNNPAKTH